MVLFGSSTVPPHFPARLCILADPITAYKDGTLDCVKRMAVGHLLCLRANVRLYFEHIYLFIFLSNV